MATARRRSRLDWAANPTPPAGEAGRPMRSAAAFEAARVAHQRFTLGVFALLVAVPAIGLIVAMAGG
jgi:hypothetical protein